MLRSVVWDAARSKTQLATTRLPASSAMPEKTIRFPSPDIACTLDHTEEMLGELQLTSCVRSVARSRTYTQLVPLDGGAVPRRLVAKLVNATDSPFAEVE